MKISEMITDRYKLRIPPTVYYDLLADVQELEEEEEPTIKNDLSVDCISREQALVAIRNLYPGMPRVDFNGSLRKWVDKNKPYIECDDAIKQLPSVTPQEPKTGKWISTETKGVRYAFWCRYKCPLCGGLSAHTNFCPNCGAKMESEDKE